MMGGPVLTPEDTQQYADAIRAALRRWVPLNSDECGPAGEAVGALLAICDSRLQRALKAEASHREAVARAERADKDAVKWQEYGLKMSNDADAAEAALREAEAERDYWKRRSHEQREALSKMLDAQPNQRSRREA